MASFACLVVDKGPRIHRRQIRQPSDPDRFADALIGERARYPARERERERERRRGVNRPPGRAASCAGKLALMVEVSVWAVRLGTIAAFAAGAVFGWLARSRWRLPRNRAAVNASLSPRVLH